MIELDGSQGEGGGQILRSSLALAILTGKPFKLVHIRANRNPPGLRPQHLMSVKAAAEICGGRYKGGAVGSDTLYFEPGDVKSGEYTFRIGTAGATGLVLHTVYLPLALRGTMDSVVTVTGGTHVSTSPCYHYLETTWAAYLRKLGIPIRLEMRLPGFYPRGGGEIRAEIAPCPAVRGLQLTRNTDLVAASGFSAVAGLPAKIATRQAQRIEQRLKKAKIESHIEEVEWEGGPGTVIAAVFRAAPVPTLFSAIGERGVSAETVADEAAEQAIAYKESGCPVDPHAADQLILPLVFSLEPSEFRVSEITKHLTTNIDVVKCFVEREITVEGELGQPGTVRMT